MISKQQFMVRQPSFPTLEPTDPYFYDLAVRLEKEALADAGFAAMWPEAVVGRAALCVIGYFQDILSDAGLWRSFIDTCRRLYGFTVPFNEVSDEYIDYELNREDVRFLMWYALSMNYEERRVTWPHDPNIIRVADAWFELLDACYDEAPNPEHYNIAHELELDNPEEAQQAAKLANWLFMHAWLLTPAYAETLAQILAEEGMQDPGKIGELQLRLERSMAEDPTGPLALYLSEWMKLMTGAQLPHPASPETSEPTGKKHPYYEKFTAYNNGERIAFFDSYDKLNRFFIEALGWADGEEHLPAMKGHHDFVLLVNPTKGMLLARDVARCIAYPSNPLYDKDYARTHAIDLLTVRGLCPADLLHFLNAGGWLPDAAFPGSDGDTALVAANFDFISRCYLQQYYRGD